MDFYEIKDAVLIGFFLAFMIGPVFFMLIQTSILKGFRAAFIFDLGVVLGDVFFIVLSYFGSKSLLEKIKDDPRLFYIGGLILIIYGIIVYLDKSRKNATEAESIPIKVKSNYLKLFIKGFLLNFINVGVLGFWLGMIVVVGANLNMNPAKIFNYFSVIIISYLITDIFKILLAKQLKKKLTSTVIYKLKRIMGIILIVFGIVLIIKGFIPKESQIINHVIEKVEQ
ncbi:MAG: LysE family translocator [Lutibacter sp.]